MYFTKLMPVALAATVPIVVAAPFQFEERQSSICQQAVAELGQAAAYYESVAATWNGEAANALRKDVSNLRNAAASIKTDCTEMDQAISNLGQTYQTTETQNANNWQ